MSTEMQVGISDDRTSSRVLKPPVSRKFMMNYNEKNLQKKIDKKKMKRKSCDDLISLDNNSRIIFYFSIFQPYRVVATPTYSVLRKQLNHMLDQSKLIKKQY